MYKYKINEKYSELKDFLLNIKTHFNDNNELIHDARNQLKVMEYKGYSLVVKSFKVPHLLNQIVYSYFRDSKAKKSYDNALHLQELNINTPAPVGYIEFYNNGLFQESFFISIKVDYAYTLRNALRREMPEYKKLIQKFTAFTYDLHQKGVWHVDYSAGNILITKDEEFYLVDINRMIFKAVPPNEGCKNFDKLWSNDEIYTIIAQEYARLSGVSYESVLHCILNATKVIQNQKAMKKRFKKNA